MSAGLNATQDAEISFITGVTSSGTLGATSFWTWNNNSPATYGATDYEAKWGASTAGTSGSISYAFDSASNWTPTEEKAFIATMDLWSDYANVSFQAAAGTGSAQLVISRASDGTAEGGITRLYESAIGSSTLGSALHGTIAVDTSIPAFGPLGAAFSDYGGYPWTTILHEEGHVLGLGHDGPYDDGVTNTTTQYTQYDSRAWSIMSYVDVDNSAVESASSTPSGGFQWGVSQGDNGRYYGDTPTTPQILDIAAVQRVYGAAVNTPLSGGQTFGFNCNIVGDTEPFFDFTKNTKPIETIWDAGVNNTLDLSGFSTASAVNLTPGTFSSCAGLTNNLSIAFGAAIDNAVTGAGNDTIIANNDGDVLSGGAGDDSLVGGAGADSLIGGLGADTLVGGSGQEHIYGNQGDDYINLTSAGASTVYGGQGNDVITAAGNPIGQQINGDSGNDTITGGAGADSLLGGDGNDLIHVGTGNAQAFGNQGDDVIQIAGPGSCTAYGGQGNDLITVTTSVGQVLHGDFGDDTLIGGPGADTIIGGPGTDVLTGGGGANQFVYSFITDSSPAAPDRITDFNQNLDHVDISAIDAQNLAAGQAAYHWVTAFDGHADEATLVYNASSNQTALELDANGDGAADFTVLLSGHVTQGSWLIF